MQDLSRGKFYTPIEKIYINGKPLTEEILWEKERKVFKAVSWDILTEEEMLEIDEFWYANGWLDYKPMLLRDRVIEQRKQLRWKT